MKYNIFLLLLSIATLSMSADNIKPGKVGNALQIEWNEYAVSDDSAALNIDHKLTLAFWVKAQNWSQMSSIVHKVGSYGILKRGGSGCYFRVQFGQWSSIDVTWVPEKYKLIPGEWYHLAMTYDAETTEGVTYLNGIETARDHLKTRQPDLDMSKINHTQSPLYIGKGAKPFSGMVDSLYLYDRVLSGSEIRQLMEEKTLPGAQLAWLFNEQSPQGVIKDSSGNHRNGKIIDARMQDTEEPQQISAVMLQKNTIFDVFHAQSTTKVFRKSTPNAAFSGQNSFIAAEMAANESESFQIVLSPHKALEIADVQITSLRGENGAEISSRSISLNTVAYVPLTTPSQTATEGHEVKGEAAVMFDKVTSSPGFYPDPLPPIAVPIQLKPSINQPFWITVKTSPDTKPGIYVGKLLLYPAQAEPVEVPFGIKVWGFALPQKFHTANYGYFPHRSKDDSGEFWNSYYISPAPVKSEVQVTVNADLSVTLNTTEYDNEVERLLKNKHINTLFFPGFECYFWGKAAEMLKRNWNGVRISSAPGELTPEFEIVLKNYLKRMSDHLRAKGWFSLYRFMLVDEPGREADWQLCRNLTKLVSSVEPELDIMLTRWPTPETQGIANVWTLGFFQPEQITLAQARGEKIEWYPNWHVFIDHLVMDTRMLGFNMWKYNLSGLFIWHLSYGWDSDNYKNVWNAPSWVYPDGRTVWGCGLLVYPDQNMKPIPSIRLAALRDTFEDYEYLHYLDSLIKQHQPDIKKQKHIQEGRLILQESIDRIVFQYEAFPHESRWKSMKWETNENILLQIRRDLAAAIENLSSPE